MLMAVYDWSASPLGPTGTWPQSLRTAISIMLSSRYAMWMLWGPELTFFCNDAYRPTLGVKGSWALGARSDKVWAEIWHELWPRIETVLTTGVATWDEGLLLFLERSGYPEETYHTFSYSPLRDDGGTHRRHAVRGRPRRRSAVIGERRLATLRRSSRASWRARRPSEDLAAAIERSLGTNRPRPAVHRCSTCSTRTACRRAGSPATGIAHRPRRRAGLAPARRCGLTLARRRADADRRTGASGRSVRRWIVCRRAIGKFRRVRCCSSRSPSRAARRPAGIPGDRAQPVPPARRRLPRVHRAGGRADRGRPRQRPRLRRGAAPGRRAGRDRPGQDHLLLQCQPRVPHAADVDAGPARGAAGRQETADGAADRGADRTAHRNGLRLLKLVNTLARLLAHRGRARRRRATSRSISPR